MFLFHVSEHVDHFKATLEGGGGVETPIGQFQLDFSFLKPSLNNVSRREKECGGGGCDIFGVKF